MAAPRIGVPVRYNPEIRQAFFGQKQSFAQIYIDTAYLPKLYCLVDDNEYRDFMLSKLMIAVGAFLMGLGGSYVAQRIDGEMSTPAILVFAMGIIFLAQAPVVALRARVRAVESKLDQSSEVDKA